MAKQLNVSLAFTADTSKAKAELQDLQRQLTQLTNAPVSNSGKGFFLTKEIQEASAAAADLKIKLQQATDINTGKLDLNKFDESLRQSGTSLKTYREALSNLGPTGDKAFASLATSIMKADVPLRTTNKLLNEFKTTLMNTARWQISSSILHGFMGTLQSAYGYAQDLNQSLNNIRIVTGYGSNEMAKFAEQANKAAQSLSTTTTKYTDAALIYYQQGLSDEEVLGRAETTIKLANVSRQSTEEVSDQLTAIWNNFYDGSQSLEYYADVITALGAATASSSEEISSGLQKFAAVSQTVGLSYEYATAALATITATTRESADTVGNGLRTLFTRLEGLKLGETLEDGVDLNKYSAALSAVGVQILDTSGELRNMDDILEDLGAKWQQLGRDQKMALAQTVGGVRQYNNLIALMDNWDFMQENLATARGSEGALQEQADIYAESWEAAQKRVRAAAEEIYQELLNDDFFITLLDGFKEVLDIINNTIDAIGGLKGVLIAIGAIATNLFQKEIASEINRIGQNIRIATGQAAQATTARKAEAAQEMQQMTANSVDENTGNAMSTVYTQQGQLQQELINNASRLSAERQKELQILLDINAAQGQNVIKAGEEADAANRVVEAERQKLLLKGSKTPDISIAQQIDQYTTGMSEIGRASANLNGLKSALGEIHGEAGKIGTSFANTESAILRLRDNIIIIETELNDGIFDGTEQDCEEILRLITEFHQRIEQISQDEDGMLEGSKTDAEELKKKIEEIENKVLLLGNKTNTAGKGIIKEDAKDIEDLGEKAFEAGQKMEHSAQANDQFSESAEKLDGKIKKPTAGMTNFGQQAAATAQIITTTVMVVNNLVNAFKTLSDPDLSTFEKITGILSSIAMTVPMVISTLATVKTTFVATGVAAGEAGATAATAGTVAATGWSAVLGPLGLVAVGIVAVTAVLFGLIKAWENFTPEGKLAKAKEEAEKSQKAYEDATKAVEDFKSAFDDWQSLYDKMSELTKGTQEYREAALQANEAALELISTYGLLKDEDWELDENGNYRILDSGLDKLQTKREEAARDNYSKKINENNADLNASASQTARELTRMSNGTGIGSQDLFNLANNYNQTSDINAIREFGIQIGVVGSELDNFVNKVQEFAGKIEENANKNETLAREIELSENRAKGPESYNEQADVLYGKYLNTYQGVNGEITKEQAEADSNNLGQLTGEKITEAYENALSSIKSSDIDDSTKQSLALALAEAQLKGSQIVDLSGVDVSGLKKAIGDKYEEVFGENADIIQAAIDRSSDQIDLESFTTNFAEIHKIIDKLSDGSIIESDDYNILMAANEGTSEFFVKMLDGTYKLIGDAEEFYNLIHGQQIDDAKKQISELQERNKGIDKVKERLTDEESGETRYLDSQAGQDLLFSNAWDQNYTDKEGNLTNSIVKDQMGLLSDLGYDQTQLDSWKEGGYTQEEMQEIADAISQYKEQLLSLNDAKAQNIQTEQELANGILMSSTSFNDLTNNMQSLLATSSEGVNLAIGYDNALISLGSQFDNCKNEVEEFKDALSSNNEEAIKAARVSLALGVNAGEMAKKYGLDADALESLAKVIRSAGSEIDGLSDDIKTNSKECIEIAKDISRFDKAVVSITKNYKNWSKALKSGNSQDVADSIVEMQEAYGDLLDLDGSKFSNQFLQSAKNLDLMEAAINGSEEAYNELLDAANQDLEGTIKNSLDPAAATEFGNSLDAVRAMMQAAGFDALQAGDDINAALNSIDDPHMSNDSFLQSLTEMVNAAGMTAEQATNFLSSMGVDAEIETITDEQPATKTVNSLEPTITYKQATNPSIADDGTLSTVDVDVPQITYAANPEQIEDTTVGAGFSLKVTSANKSSGGGTKLKNSSHGSGNGKKGGGGGGRRGGGGRGREFRKIDRTEKDEKQKKKVEDEIERYHKVKNELQDIEKELSLIGKEKDRAFGRNKIRQIDAETASLKKQSETQKKYLSEIQGWLEKDNAKAKEFGFEINGEGLVTNYEENMKKLIDKVNSDYDDYIAKLNALEDAYNAAGVDDEDSKKKLEDDKKALAKEWEANQKYYEDAKEALSKQEETHDLLIEQQEALQDMLNNIYDNGITKITYVVELKVDVADRDIALLQDYLEDIGDKADGAGDAIANFGNQLEKVLEKTDAYTQGVADILQHADADEDLIDSILNHTFDENDWDEVLSIGQDGKGLNEEEIQYLKDAADALLSHNQELRELREQALQKTSEAFEEFNEQLDRGVVKIEHLTIVTQTYRDVLDIVGKDVLDRNGKLTDALNKQTYNIQRNHTHALQSQLDFIDTALEKAKGLYDEAVQNGYNQKTLESLKADVEKYEDERQATYEEWLDSWREECQIAKDYYEDTLNQILQDFEDAVAGQFKNLSGLSEEFARKNEIADIYVEDYEKIYQLSKLNRDINNSLDDSTTLASKAKLRDIQKEINDLQESGVEVSQYDLDVLQKKYEMALAYEQWQDAQNAKTVVRMQRDNEGNYGYVYTADQADVEAAEQNYEDKLHEMQVLNAEYIQSLQEQIIQAQQDCADALANLRAEDFASYEEYQDAVEQIRKDYTKRVETLSQQMGNAMDNNRTLYEQDWTAYSQATGYKISADEDYIDKFNETVYSQLTGFQTMEEAQNAFVEAVNDASDLAAQNWEDWYVRTNTALDDAGMSMQNYANEVGDTVEQLGEEAERAEEDVWNMSEEFSDAYSTISDTVGGFLDEYSNYIDSMIDANQALIDSINQVIRAYAELHGLEDDDDDDDSSPMQANDYKWKNLKEGTGEYEWVYENSQGNRKKGTFSADWTTEQGEHYWADYDTDENGIVQASPENFLHNGYFGSYNKRTSQYGEVLPAEVIPMGNNDYELETGNVVVISRNTDVQSKNTSSGPASDTSFDDLVKYYGPGSFDTGGYTGDWGSSKRMAFLHEKELVLNADDTENILSAVDMIRSISKTIDLNALAAGSIFASPNSAYKSSFGSRDSLEQNVHIQAEFPNVSDHNEIEEALNNLIERAAQFAGRKNL